MALSLCGCKRAPIFAVAMASSQPYRAVAMKTKTTEASTKKPVSLGFQADFKPPVGSRSIKTVSNDKLNGVKGSLFTQFDGVMKILAR